MYIDGRLRTGSSPSRTMMSFPVYFVAMALMSSLGEPTEKTSSSEDFIHSDAPTGDRRLRVGDVAGSKHDGLCRVGGAVAGDRFRDRIDVPDDLRSGGEVIDALRGHLVLGRVAIVVLAAHLDGERWRTFDE